MENSFNQDKKLWSYFISENKDVFSLTHNRHKRVFNQIKKYIKPKSKLLEIGFGDGYLLKKLSKFYDCYGADITEKFVEKIKKDILDINFKTINTDGIMPYEDNFFDGFIASEVLEHMTDKELKICVNEIKRVLKENGYAFITVPAEEDLKANECFCPNCNTVFHRWGHQQSWNYNKIRELFKHFKIVKISNYFVRYEGSNILEKVIGYLLFVSRNIFNKFHKLPNRSYLAILKKI